MYMYTDIKAEICVYVYIPTLAAVHVSRALLSGRERDRRERARTRARTREREREREREMSRQNVQETRDRGAH